MGTRKLKKEEVLYEIDTQNSDDSDYCAADPTYSSAKNQKRRKKKKNIMQVESKEKGTSRKNKSLKSKDNQGSDNSKKSASNARKRTRYGDLYDDIEAQFCVMERAERVLAHLEHEFPFPHFIKCMLPSNVAHGFWLHLPKKFCSAHLPHHDTPIVLVDEWGNEYKTSYLLERHGLSAGWRGFSISHRLLKGDILIFHLIAPCKFKVHTVRVHDADVVGAALCLMNMDASGRGTFADTVRRDDRKRKKTKYVEPFPLDIFSPPENVKGKNVPSSVLAPVASTSNGFCSEVTEGLNCPFYKLIPLQLLLKPLSFVGSEISNRPQSTERCYSKNSFHHTREGVTCR